MSEAARALGGEATVVSTPGEGSRLVVDVSAGPPPRLSLAA